MVLYCVRTCAELFCAEKIAAISSLYSGSDQVCVYTNRYLLMHIKSSMFENYELLNFKKNKHKKTLWDRFTNAISRYGTQVHNNRLSSLNADFATYSSTYIDDTFRNNTFHYARSSYEYYKQIKGIVSAESILEEAEKFATLLASIISLANDVEAEILKTSQITLPVHTMVSLNSVRQQQDEVETLFTQKNVDMLETLLTQVHIRQNESKSLFEGTEYFKAEYDKLPNTIGIHFQKPSIDDTHKFAQETIQGYMYVYAAILDIITNVLSYHRASTFCQKLLLIHRIHICVRGIMERIYQKDKQTQLLTACIWKSIKDEIDKTTDLNLDYTELQARFDEFYTKVTSGDERNILVHYFNDNKPNVKQFINIIANKNPCVEIGKGLAFIFLLHDFQNTIYRLIMHKAKVYDEQRERDMAQIKDNLANIEQHINNCADPDKRAFLTEMLKLAKGVQSKL